MLSMVVSSPEAPKPGWCGTISRNCSASGKSASNPVTVPAPWKKTSGSPSPAVKTAVSTPSTSRRCSLNPSISVPSHGHELTVVGRGRGAAQAGADPRDDLVREHRHVLHGHPFGHVRVLEDDVH